jgi:hypothetical protein
MKYDMPELLLAGSAKTIVLGADVSTGGGCTDNDSPTPPVSDQSELW